MKTHINFMNENASFTQCGVRTRGNSLTKEKLEEALEKGKIKKEDVCKKCLAYLYMEVA